MPGYGAWTPQSPIQSLHFETDLPRYECPTRPDIETMLTDHSVIVSPRGQYAALCISNLKSQILNLNSQFSILTFQFSNLKSQIAARWVSDYTNQGQPSEVSLLQGLSEGCLEWS